MSNDLLRDCRGDWRPATQVMREREELRASLPQPRAATIIFDGGIVRPDYGNGISGASFSKALDKTPDVREFTLDFRRSRGGHTCEMWPMIDAIKAHPAQIKRGIVKCEAQSATTMIFLSLDEQHREIYRDAILMIHAPWSEDQSASAQASVERDRQRMIAFTQSRLSHLPKTMVSSWFEGEPVYFNASDALRLGLASKIIDGAADIDPYSFNIANKRRPWANAAVQPTTPSAPAVSTDTAPTGFKWRVNFRTGRRQLVSADV